ncbi:MAG: rod shape-determining protein MreC [Candidatus Paceibacterota bacterium]
MKHIQFILILICLLVGTSVFATSVFVKKPSFLLGSIQGIFSSVSLDDQRKLIQENEDLKNQLYAGQHTIVITPQETLQAKVFSLYPFNTKNRLFIDKGEHDSIHIGSAVLFSLRVFVGQIQEIEKTSGEVITVFDSALRIPVRIGSEEVNGLLQGGVTPRITLIDKAKKVHGGDLIITATKDMPYGLTVGTIREVHEDALGAFLEATIELPYTINDLRTVLVVR